MAIETLEIKCPGCDTVLIVNRKNGKVLEVRKPLLDKDEATGDRFDDARKRVDQMQERIDQKVEAAKKAEREKLARLDALFKERKSEIEEKGEAIERPDIFRD